MKGLFWNLRGVANPPTRLALQNLIKTNKPDFVLLAEPWMDFNKFPAKWLQRLGLKLFALNNRQNLLPNLRCICSINLNPSILSITNQLVSFSLSDNNVKFGISAIYASTFNLIRRELWCDLQALQSQYDFLGASLGILTPLWVLMNIEELSLLLDLLLTILFNGQMLTT